MTLTVLIIGCGDIGITLGRELLSEGHRVIGVRRHVDALQDTGIEPLALDLNSLEEADASALPKRTTSFTRLARIALKKAPTKAPTLKA